jgi:crotonobetainyl-CoA:carnitine CoA-transferase CaiB-like acyl-CoA transferase
VFGYDQIMNDSHIKARRMVVDIDHPKIGRMKTLGLPIKSSGDLTSIRMAAPWLGQHSAEVLRGLGYTEADVDALFTRGVIFEKYRGGDGCA